MHISLDSALGRDQRLNSLGETINSIAAPAAAYSLRSLTGGDPKVVRVRREGDNGEQDFTVSEINSGALVDYINTNGVFQNTGYESFSNASASGFTASNTGSTGFAVSDLPDGTSGTAISVSFDISITNGSPSISLRTALDGGSSASNSVNYTSSGSKTATLTATGSYAGVGFTEGDAPSNFTVSNFKILGDGFVETWYDQSGNGNNATQTTAANQPKIVNSGVLLTKGVTFDGTNDSLALTSTLGQTNLGSSFSVVELDSTTSTKTIIDNRDSGSDGFVLFHKDDAFQFKFASTTETVSSDSTSQLIVSAFKTSSNQGIGVNGGTLEETSNTSTINVSSVPVIGSRSFSGSSNISWDGEIAELILYNSDQSSNRTAIETNINSHYSLF